MWDSTWAALGVDWEGRVGETEFLGAERGKLGWGWEWLRPIVGRESLATQCGHRTQGP